MRSLEGKDPATRYVVHLPNHEASIRSASKVFTHIGIEIHHLLGKCAIEREDGKDKGWGRRDGGNGRSNCEEGLVVILLTSRCYVGNSRSVSLPGSDVKLRVLAHQAAHATVHAKTMGPAHPSSTTVRWTIRHTENDVQ
jgi:hypothetical protein